MNSALVEPRRLVGESSLVGLRDLLEENGGWNATELIGESAMRKKCKSYLGAMGAMESTENDGNDDSFSIDSSEFELAREDTWAEFLTRIWDDGLDFVLDAFIEVLDAITDVPVFHFTLRLLFRFHMLE